MSASFSPDMHDRPKPPAGAIVGIALGLVFAAIFIVGFILLCLRLVRKRGESQTTKEVSRSYSLPMRIHGVDTSIFMSDNMSPQQSQLYPARFGVFSFWGRSIEESSTSSHDRIMRFTYKELEKATKNFRLIIGKGAFGPVYKAILPNTSVVAVKVLATNSKQGEKEFQNEVMLLGRLHHKNLLNLVGYCSEGGHRILAYDYMNNGSLAARLHDEHYDVLNWGQRISIAQDIARGIEYLHDGAVPPVIHRDIKASNILLDSFMVARVADFGLSKEANSDILASGIRGTYGYVDPEYVSTNSLTYKSDVYSFGVLLFEIIAGRSPEEGVMEYVELVLLANGGREIWLQILDTRLKGECNLKELGELASIATKCVEREARKRPKIREIVQALSRLGPKSESARLDFGNFSFKGLERIDGTERGMLSTASSRVEARG